MDIFRSSRGRCIILHYVRKKQCVGHPMRSVIMGTQRMGHGMNDAQTDIAEPHTGNVLRLRHGLAGNRIAAIVYGSFQMDSNHFNGFQFEHIRHSPCTRRYIAFYGMSQCIHTGCSSQSFRHGIHQLRVNNSYCRNIIRVYTNHLFFDLFVNDNIIDGHLSSSSRRSR